MAYVYDESTGNFIEKPGATSPSGGSPGQDPPHDDWKKWLKIAGKVALPVLSIVLLATTGIALPGHD